MSFTKCLSLRFSVRDMKMVPHERRKIFIVKTFFFLLNDEAFEIYTQKFPDENRKFL